MYRPWSNEVVELHPRRLKPSTATTGVAQPWAVELANGQRCFKNTGTGGDGEGNVLDFICRGKPQSALIRDSLDQSGSVWRAESTRYLERKRETVEGPRVTIRTAWVVAPEGVKNLRSE